MMFPALLLITLRQWRTHKLRLALTTLSIALGVAVFFAIRTGNSILLDSLKSTVERLAGKATLQVTAGESGLPEEVLETVRATPGVRIAQPVIEVIADTSFGDEGRLLVLGVDTTGDRELRDYEFDRSRTEIADPLLFLAQPNSILLSRAFAERHSLRLGDRLALFASEGRREFTVRGVFQPVGLGAVFGGNIAVMDVYSAQLVFNRGHNFDRIDLMNFADVPIETVQQRLRARLASGVEVLRPEVRGEALENAVTAMRIGMLMTSFVALLVCMYIIFNSFTIAVNQRWKEIGVLRAVGVERRNIRGMFLAEALLMGVLGSLLGIAAGYCLAGSTGRVMGTIAAAAYGLVSTPERVSFQLGFTLSSFVLGVGASLAGAWFPARAASQLDPVLALHNIETRQAETVLGWRRMGAGGLLVATGFALIRWSSPRTGLTFQFVYAGGILLGLTLLLPRLVQWAARALRPLMDWAAGSEGALAIDSMIQSPRRSAATVGALMVGLMFVFSTEAYIQGYRRVIDRWMNEVLNSDLFVATSTLMRSPTYHFSEELGRQIADIPGVKRVEDIRFTSVPYRGDTPALVAIEMDGFLARAQDAVEGADGRSLREQLPRGEGVLISRNFSTRWGLGVGDHVRLDAPSGPIERPILGILDDYRSEKGTIFMERALYKKYWGDSAVDFIDVNLAPGADPGKVKQEIQRFTSNTTHAFVYTNAEFKRWVAGLVDQFFMLNYMQLVIAILVAMLGIINTLLISVSERRREMGILRAIGGLRSQIRKLVLLEAVAISLVGVLMGALAAVFNTEFLTHAVSIALAGYHIPFYFPWPLVLWSLPFVVAASLLAGWWPASRAVRMQVVEAIGYE
jgi:putative ABC transport system permease protein